MKILITAGPTHEPIDPVRFIGNHSSGKMGIAIAEVYAEKGHEVTLVLGATSLRPLNKNIQVVSATSASAMFEACTQYFQGSDVIVFAAAVADYTPKDVSETKIKKNDAKFTLTLVKTVDIAAELGMQDSGAGFQHDTNKITIIDKIGNQLNFELKPKTAVAEDIYKEVEKRFVQG
jgi:phosphopantothenoylcysteine decarboxylase/phosphopantothenate--cysteine ligase